MAPRPGVTIRISTVHAPVRVLGHGERVGIWVQGCSIGCRGCIAVDTWNPDPRFDRRVDDVLGWVRSLDAGALDGVTISGGEPFEQPEALRALLEGLHAWRDTERARSGRELDLLCYSGMPEARLRAEHADILALLDVVVPEPFVRERAAPVPLRGSDNQRIVPLTPLGVERYTGAERLAELAAQRGRLQYREGPGETRLFGIPLGDDIPEIVRELGRAGIRLSRRGES